MAGKPFGKFDSVSLSIFFQNYYSDYRGVRFNHSGNHDIELVIFIESNDLQENSNKSIHRKRYYSHTVSTLNPAYADIAAKLKIIKRKRKKENRDEKILSLDTQIKYLQNSIKFKIKEINKDVYKQLKYPVVEVERRFTLRGDLLLIKKGKEILREKISFNESTSDFWHHAYPEAGIQRDTLTLITDVELKTKVASKAKRLFTNIMDEFFDTEARKHFDLAQRFKQNSENKTNYIEELVKYYYLAPEKNDPDAMCALTRELNL